MLRRDYILRMIQDFFAALRRIQGLKQEQKWNEAAAEIDEEFKRLAGADAATLANLSETELIARLLKSDSGHALRENTLFVVTLFKERADALAAEGKNEQSLAYYIKGLNLLLALLAREEVLESPEFVPKVEEFVLALGDVTFPTETQALLMQHYERNGELGKAEDILYSLLDGMPTNPQALEFGISFYQRISTKSDSELEEGNLPRSELESGLAELRQRKKESAPAR